METQTVTLNRAQQDTLAELFAPDNPYQDPDHPEMEVTIIDGQLVINDVYLWPNGDFATFPNDRS